MGPAHEWVTRQIRSRGWQEVRVLLEEQSVGKPSRSSRKFSGGTRPVREGQLRRGKRKGGTGGRVGAGQGSVLQARCTSRAAGGVGFSA